MEHLSKNLMFIFVIALAEKNIIIPKTAGGYLVANMRLLRSVSKKRRPWEKHFVVGKIKIYPKNSSKEIVFCSPASRFLKVTVRFLISSSPKKTRFLIPFFTA